LIRLTLAPADLRLTLELRSPEPLERRALRIFWNGRPVPTAPDGSYRLRRRWFRRGEQLLERRTARETRRRLRCPRRSTH